MNSKTLALFLLGSLLPALFAADPEPSCTLQTQDVDLLLRCGNDLVERGKSKKGKTYLDRAVQVSETENPGGLQHLEALEALAKLAWSRSYGKRASAVYRDSLDRLDGVLPASDPVRVTLLLEIANETAQTRQYRRAVEWSSRAVEIATEIYVDPADSARLTAVEAKHELLLGLLANGESEGVAGWDYLGSIEVATVEIHDEDEDGLTKPVVLDRPMLGWPRDVQGHRGTVVLQALILSDGTVGALDVLKATPQGSGFEAAAIRNIRRWTYSPAMKDGRPVACSMETSLTFEAR